MKIYQKLLIYGMGLISLNTLNLYSQDKISKDSNKTEYNQPFINHGIVYDGFGLSEGGVAVGDLDGDGDLDIVLSNGEMGVYWLENEKGNLINRGNIADKFVTLFKSPSDVALGDMDNDGDLDIIVRSKKGAIKYIENRIPQKKIIKK